MPDKTDAVMELAKRRGFLWPSFEVYGGAAGFYDYGPLGATMKKRFEDLWRHIFVTTEATPMAEIFCPRVTPEPVLVASGHVGEFTDLLVTCTACKAPTRADHLVTAAGYKGNAGALKAPEIDAQLVQLKPKCPACSKQVPFTPAVKQNLMNATEIGPGSGRVGYMRPETAQGIFTDFPLLFRHFRDRLPFGVVQLGGSNRNEISPRQGMLRLREFSMMEAEVFYDPTKKTHPRFAEVANRKAIFVPNSDEQDHETTFGQAVETGMVANEALAYWLARTQEFLLAAGIDPKKLHFRQHLKDEMAHYAADCWDAEFHSDRYGWVECVGIADRGSYDLTQHAKHSGKDEKHPATGETMRRMNAEFLRAVSPMEPVTLSTLTYKPSKKFFPTLRQDAKKAEWALQFMTPYAEAAKDAGLDTFDWPNRHEQYFIVEKESPLPEGTRSEVKVTVSVNGQEIVIPPDCIDVVQVEATVQGRRILPCVIEPSFGVDRILYALWEHAYEAGEKNGESYTRLKLSPRIAPIHLAVLPLTGKDGLPEKALEIQAALRAQGLATDYDESGNIGRRYARQDEVGTPFCATVDNETLVDGKVTIRQRDSGAQERVAIQGIGAYLYKHLT